MKTTIKITVITMMFLGLKANAQDETVNGDLLIERGNELNFSVAGAKRAGISSTNTSPYNELQFFTGGHSEAMRIDLSGNVGIGIDDPRAKLDLVGGDLFLERGYELNFSAGGDRRAGISSTNTSPYNELQFFTGGHFEAMRIDINGYVGMGTGDPYEQLHIIGKSLVENSNGHSVIVDGYSGIETFGPSHWLHINRFRNDDVAVGHNSTANVFLVNGGGNVGIGTSAPTQKLSVKGAINAEELILEDVYGADFVFEEDYDLRSLEETEKFIQANKHLPEVPSAAEMAEEGLQLKEMNILLLQKVEELTLHLIEQNKKTEAQQAAIEALEAKIDQLEKR